MKETIAKINEVMAVLQAELAKAAEGKRQLLHAHAKQHSNSRNSEKSSANSLSPSSNSQARRKYDSSHKTIVLRELSYFLFSALFRDFSKNRPYSCVRG